MRGTDTTHTLKDVKPEHSGEPCDGADWASSGCGKSTFVRCLNRKHETDPIGPRGRAP